MPRDKIVLDQVTKTFPQAGPNQGRQGEFVAVEGLSFAVKEGERVAIIGRTGCGKSTCLNLINGLIPVTSGKVMVDGLNPYTEFMKLKGRIATVFQNDRLLPWRSTLENAKIGLQILEYPREEQERITMDWLRKVGLKGFEHSYPHMLSGGMKQRVNLARAFALDPSILLLDEAFGHLDEVTAKQLRSDFLNLVTSVDETKRAGTTVFFVTHQIEEAIEVASRIIVLAKPARLLADMYIEQEAKSDLRLANEYRAKLVKIIGEASSE
ncbi:MAG: ABC transporter ATP-binding protein [Candidatus Binatia bacterium]